MGWRFPPALSTTLTIVILAVMLLGLLSLLLYVIPGLTIIWLAGLIYGFLKGFDRKRLVDFRRHDPADDLRQHGSTSSWMGAKAKQSGASWVGVILSTIAALVFSVLFPPFGGLVWLRCWCCSWWRSSTCGISPKPGSPRAKWRSAAPQPSPRASASAC